MTSSLEDLLVAHMNRPMPTFLDQEVIATTPDEAVEDKIYDFALVKIGRDFDKEEQVISSLAVGVRSLYVTSLVHREVCNGGFNQFYFNSSGKFALLAPSAFEFFGAYALAAVVRAANSARASEAKWMRAITRIRTIENFMQSYRHTKLRALDERYWEQQEALSPLRIAKIRATPEDFYGT
jgi:hypothetical protein